MNRLVNLLFRATSRSRFSMALLALILAGIAPPAVFATTYYVRSDGSDSNSGAANAAGSAWRTLGKANSTLAAGDVVQVVSLNPADTSGTTNTINPSRNGTSTAAITYLGNASSPALLPVPAIDVQRSYVRVIGFRAKDGAYITTPNSSNIVSGSVVQSCIIVNDAGFRSSFDSRISDCVMLLRASGGTAGDQPTAFSVHVNSFTGAPYPQRDTLRNNSIVINPINCEARAFAIRGYSSQCVFERNRVNATFDNRGIVSSAVMLTLYESSHNTFRDNHWNIEILNSTMGTGRWYPINTRSGTNSNTFQRDTFDIDVEAPHFYSYATLSQESSPVCSIQPAPASFTCDQQAHDNSWLGCIFRSPSGEVTFQNLADHATIRNCTFIGDAYPALSFVAGMGDCEITHNTIYSKSKRAFMHDGSVYNSTIQGNIIMSGAASCSMPVQEWAATGGFVQDQNLFYSSSGSSSSAVKVTNCYSVGTGSSWYTSYGHDGNSIWADPLLADINLATFNAALRIGSPALNARFPGGYAGAVAAAALPDLSAPATVTDLRTAP